MICFRVGFRGGFAALNPHDESIFSEISLNLPLIHKAKKFKVIFDYTKLPLVLTGVFLLLYFSETLWRWDNLIYDTYLRYQTQSPPDDIIIVAVDEMSLSQLGRWPWSRQIHAQLVNILSQAGAKVIALDVIFAEANQLDQASDRALVNAIRASKRVVLPVFIEQIQAGGQLIETLPMSPLIDASAGLGQVHVDIDADGITRRTFLYQGLGNAHWPHLALEVLRVIHHRLASSESHARRSQDEATSVMTIKRDQQILIPFAGPPGHFHQISYAQVLSGQFPTEFFQDKIILVGATAVGLGDVFPTPMSGLSSTMSGVEINANIIQAVRSQHSIKIIPIAWFFILSLIFVLLPAFLFPRTTPGSAIILIIILLTSSIVLVYALLQLFHYWFPPSVVLLTLGSSYPVWSWWRLNNALRYLNNELQNLKFEKELLPWSSSRLSMEHMEFIRHLLPVKAWILIDNKANIRLQWGDINQLCHDRKRSLQLHNIFWMDGEIRGTTWRLGVHWQGKYLPDAEQLKLTQDLFTELIGEFRFTQKLFGEKIQKKIQEVQQLATQVRLIRQYVLQSMEQMADGVIVVSVTGEIEMANKQVGRYLFGNENYPLKNQAIQPILTQAIAEFDQDLYQVFTAVLLKNEAIQFSVKSKTHTDLLIHFSPLQLSDVTARGIIINLSDISGIKAHERNRTEMLNFLSHDLRAPIVSLLALVEMAKQDPVDLNMLIQRMENYAHKTLELAETFVQVNRIESGESIALQSVNLDGIIYNAMDQLWAQAKTKNIEFVFNNKAYESEINGNAELLERVFVNLFSNAIKYSSSGSTITIDLILHNHFLRCCVNDQGSGIRETDLKKIFEKFQRFHHRSHKHEPGLGLGLSFVKAVIDRLNAQISVNSTVGEGTQVCMLFELYD